MNVEHGRVEMAHGAGGRAMAQLIAGLFAAEFDNEYLAQGNDGALLPQVSGRLVMATDSHVVSPLFFPGGDIGSLSVHGTINDVAMMGAAPLYLAASFILEEGLPLSELRRIVVSMARAAKDAGVPVVTGDTKVVERGKGDGLFITTTGVGVVPDGVRLSGELAEPGDAILLSGSIGDHGMAVLAAREGLDMPIVSGNVSLYNETSGIAIPPTPAIGAIGLLDDIDHMATIAFKQDGDVIFLIGETSGHLGQSIYAREIAGRSDGAPPPVDLAAERRNGDFVRTQIISGNVTAAHDISDGGLIVALTEMALAGDRGCTLNLPKNAGLRHAYLFGEDQARYVLSVAPSKADALIAAANAKQVPVTKLGMVGGRHIMLDGNPIHAVTELRHVHENWFPDYMEG